MSRIGEDGTIFRGDGDGGNKSSWFGRIVAAAVIAAVVWWVIEWVL